MTSSLNKDEHALYLKTPRLTAAGVFLFSGVLLVLALCAGCSVVPAGHDKIVSGYMAEKIPPLYYLQEVPFYPGDDFQCGPSVLAGALNFIGYDVKPEDISKEIYIGGVRGTLNIDMVSYAQRFEGVSVSEFRGDIASLKENLLSGHPLIVFVDLGIWSIRKGHYMLVVGYDDSREGVVVYSGAEKDKFISYGDFLRIWKRGGYWTLLITTRISG